MNVKHAFLFISLSIILTLLSTALIFKFISVNQYFSIQAESSHKQQLDNPIIAIINGKKIWKNDLNIQEKQELYDAEKNFYQATENIISKKYFNFLVQKYMNENNIEDKETGKQKFIEANIKLSDEEISDFISQNKENPQFNTKTTTEKQKIVLPYLIQKKTQEYLNRFIAKSIREKEVQIIFAKKPVTPKLNIKINGAPYLGSENAPITIIEFSDFQCPFCLASLSTISELLKDYKNNIKFVHKDYPRVSLHPQALEAAIAAQCAFKQNKFWEAHKFLFENQNKLGDELFTNMPNQISLDNEEYKVCKNDPKIRSFIMEQINYAQTLGVMESPTFFVNGVKISGLQSKEEFIKIIESNTLKGKSAIYE